MRQFPRGLSTNIESATTVLARAQLRLRANDADRREAGLGDWLDAFAFSQAVGFAAQVEKAKRIVREPGVRSRLPEQIKQRWCSRCGEPRTWIKGCEDRQVFYLCLGCKKEIIPLP
jgi:hypothetical protein